MTKESVERLFRERREEINAETCRNCIKHVRRVEESYWETDRIMDEQMNKFLISVGDTDSEDERELDLDD